MKTNILFLSLIMFLSIAQAQNDTMYIMRQGSLIGQYKVTEVDSIIFYRPKINPYFIPTAQVPAGTFIMGSPITEMGRFPDETQFQVTLRAFKMSVYEISNAQFAAFLNAKSIGSDGIYAAGAFPAQALIFATKDNVDWGLHYDGSHWVPVVGFENHPVINETWYGATEFATNAGGRLPTEAEWEYACRANTTSPFNTGDCLSNTQANYDWSSPFSTCANFINVGLGKTETVGSYSANAFGLNDMHGNIFEWCSDWYGTYPTTAQTNPTGPISGTDKVARGGSWVLQAQYCRSAIRQFHYTPNSSNYNCGFRIVLAP